MATQNSVEIVQVTKVTPDLNGGPLAVDSCTPSTVTATDFQPKNLKPLPTKNVLETNSINQHLHLHLAVELVYSQL
jgi:hypothetical protein